MRRGVRLGVDVGKARVGLAQCDRDGLLATPVATIPRDEALQAIRAAAEDSGAIECVVGLPIGLHGGDTLSTADARLLAEELARELSIPVRLVDERLSTVSASQQLRHTGVRAKKQRQMVDQVAAVIILQHCLDTERSHGEPPGTIVLGAT